MSDTQNQTGTSPITPEQEADLASRAEHPGYIHRVFKGLDEELNVITDGRLGQSMSSRIGLDAAEGKKPAEIMAKALDLVQKNHTVKAEVADMVQAEAVVNAEKKSPDLPPYKEEHSI